LDFVSLTVTAAGDRAVFLLCANKGSNVFRKFAASFRTMPAELQTAAIVEYVVCQFENFIMLPAWWESLAKDIQQKFVNGFQGRFYPRGLPNICDWKLKEVNPEN
jgi:hypothetical protein